MAHAFARRLRAAFGSTRLLVDPLEARLFLSGASMLGVVAVPTGLVVKAASASAIQLRWNSDPGATGFIVQRSADGNTGWVLAGLPGRNATSFLDTSLSAGTSYYYRIQAQAATGPSGYSAVAGTATLCIAPGNVQWTNCASSTITLSWSNVYGDSGYTIERSGSKSGGWIQVGSTGMDVNTSTDSGLSSASRYYYRVRAVDSSGASVPSSVVLGLTTPNGAHETVGPLTTLDWSAPTTPLATQTPMIGIYINGSPTSAFYDNVIASWAAQSRTAPPGQAALLLNGALGSLMSDPLDCCQTASGTLTSYVSPWLDHGVADVQAQASNFFADGGRADYIVDDYEGNLSYWGLSIANIQAIQADPRSVTLTQTLGPTIFTDLLAGKASALYAWDDAMERVISNAINAAEFNIAAQYFPNARMSNYDNFIMTPQYVVPDASNWWQYNSSIAGNRQAPAFYGGIAPNLANAILPGTQTPYGSSAFAALRLVTNTMRAAALSSPIPIDPWIAGAGYLGSAITGAYYQEAIYHEALAGAESFLYWNPAPVASDAQNALVDQTVTTLNQELGSGPRWSVTPAEMAWDSPLVVSGMQTGTQVVWRVTAPPGINQIKVVETGQILSLNGAAGVWYTSKAGQAIDFAIAS